MQMNKSLENAQIKLDVKFEEIADLESSYYDLNQQYNDITLIVSEIDYVEEWKIRELQIFAFDALQLATQEEINTLQEILDETTIPELRELLEEEISLLEEEMGQREQEINILNQEISELEQQNIESLQIDSQLESELINSESQTYQKYVDNESSEFVGENPMDAVYVDYRQKRAVTLIDDQFDQRTNSKNTKFSMSPVGITENILENVGRDKVRVNFETTEVTSGCTSVTVECNTLIGGLELGRDTDPGVKAGTLGYKATYAGKTGFVTAAHVVDFYCTNNDIMMQNKDGRDVGTVEFFNYEGSSCPRQYLKYTDVAFVETLPGISIDDDIYIGSLSTYDVVGYVNSPSHVGNFLHRVGATTGLQWLSVDGNSSNGLAWFDATTVGQGGDSGGPVFKHGGSGSTGYTATIYGHVLTPTSYQKVDKVVGFGIIPKS